MLSWICQNKKAWNWQHFYLNQDLSDQRNSEEVNKYDASFRLKNIGVRYPALKNEICVLFNWHTCQITKLKIPVLAHFSPISVKLLQHGGSTFATGPRFYTVKYTVEFKYYSLCNNRYINIFILNIISCICKTCGVVNKRANGWVSYSRHIKAHIIHSFPFNP